MTIVFPDPINAAHPVLGKKKTHILGAFDLSDKMVRPHYLGIP